MKNILLLFLLAFTVVLISSCDGARETGNTEVANTGTEPAKDLKASVVDLEKSAYEAWQKKDGKFFEDFLSDRWVSNGREGRGTKEMTVKGISDNPCEVKSFAKSDEEMVELGDGVVLLTSKDVIDVACDGKALPGSSMAATVYVKEGDKWRAMYHQTRADADAKGEYPKAGEGAGDKAPEDSDKELTDKLMAIDKGLWEAWSKKDTKPFEAALSDKYVGINREGRWDRAAYIQRIGDNKCEVKNLSQADPRTTKISDTISLLTYKASVEGACEERELPNTIWSTSIYVKDGEDWKSAFWMGTPAT